MYTPQKMPLSTPPNFLSNLRTLWPYKATKSIFFGGGDYQCLGLIKGLEGIYIQVSLWVIGEVFLKNAKKWRGRFSTPPPFNHSITRVFAKCGLPGGGVNLPPPFQLNITFLFRLFRANIDFSKALKNYSKYPKLAFENCDLISLKKT